MGRLGKRWRMVGISICFSFGVALILGWIASVPLDGSHGRWFDFDTPDFRIQMLFGRFEFVTPSLTTKCWGNNYSFDVLRLPQEPLTLRSFGVSLPSVEANKGVTVIRVPLWVPFSLVMVAAFCLWHPGRLPKDKTHCRNCAYNLVGNISGVCPECGTPIAEPRMNSVSI